MCVLFALSQEDHAVSVLCAIIALHLHFRRLSWAHAVCKGERDTVVVCLTTGGASALF